MNKRETPVATLYKPARYKPASNNFRTNKNQHRGEPVMQVVKPFMIACWGSYTRSSRRRRQRSYWCLSYHCTGVRPGNAGSRRRHVGRNYVSVAPDLTQGPTSEINNLSNDWRPTALIQRFRHQPFWIASLRRG